MCGIAAIVDPAATGTSLAGLIGEMTAAVRHRGPDDEGYALLTDEAVRCYGGADTPADCWGAPFPYAPAAMLGADGPAGSIALGHRRLAIIDLSPAGHQPMTRHDGRYVLAYNGEIYNYRELRAELEAEGAAFTTGSDTEVIIEAYHRWGRGCLPRFNGMFAFVLVDRARDVVFAARDRFAVKPLYWWRSPAGLVAFASEIKQFLGLPGWRATMNPARVADYLNWGMSDHTPETLFAGVRQLRGGEAVEWAWREAPRPPAPFRWYELRPRPTDLSFADAAARYEELFADSIRLRLRADVPVATCLSGGLDSSAVVCMVNRFLTAETGQPRQLTFSACSHHPEFDEREFIEAVTSHLGIESQYTFPQLDELFDVLDRIVWHHDEPFLGTSVYAEWKVFETVGRAGIKVTLDGHGADEQLAGYHTFYGPHLAGLFRSLRWFRLVREAAALRRLHGYGARHSAQKVLAYSLPDALVQGLLRGSARPNPQPEWIDLRALGLGDEAEPPFDLRQPSIRATSLTQLTRSSVPLQLHWSDRDSMAHSVESREPYLDYRLVEFVVGLPDEYKIRDGVTKRVLREGLRDLLPDKVRTRVDKMGFVTPEEVWVRRDDPERFRKEIAATIERSGGVFTPALADRVDAVLASDGRYDPSIWRALCLGRWLDRFDVSL